MDTKELKTVKEEYATKISGQVVSLIGELENKTGIKVIGIWHNINSISDHEGKTIGTKVTTNLSIDV